MTEVEAARIMVNEARSSLRRDLGIQAGAWVPDQVDSHFSFISGMSDSHWRP